MGVNVRSLYLVTRAFLKSMLDAGTGTIVNIASLAGKNGGEGGTAYCASKHAVLGFSKSLMLEVRKRGLRVVAICPGSVSTPFMDKRERVRPAPDRALGAEDVAHAVVATLTVSDRAMISEVDIRPTNPYAKGVKREPSRKIVKRNRHAAPSGTTLRDVSVLRLRATSLFDTSARRG